MIVNLKSKSELSGLFIVFEGSTNIETPGIYGISHYLEHTICYFFKKYRGDFIKDSIEWNATTDLNNITFYFIGLEEHLSKYRKGILDLMFDFNVTKDRFETERNIILQEYTDTFNNQSQSHQLNLFRKLFGSFDAVGLKKDIETFKMIDAMNFYEKQFLNPSKIINVSKTYKFKEDDLEFSDIKIDKKFEYGNNNVPFELDNEFKDKTSIVLLSPIFETEFPYIKFINDMLGSGLSSPLYSEIRERLGLVYHISCKETRINKQGISDITTQTTNENVEKVLSAIKKVLKNPSKFLTKERFEIIKSSHKSRIKQEDINRHKHVERWIEPENWSISSIIDDITYNDVLEVYEEYYDFNKFYLSIDKTEFKK